jgi:site-specific DNA-methyltransferase (adenine-specific)
MTAPYYSDDSVTLYHGDCLDVMRTMPDATFDLVFTSPPYNLGVSSGGGFAAPGSGAKTGLWSGGALADGYAEHDDALPFEQYVEWQHEVLRECWRLIKPTGAIYYQHKPRVQNGILQTPLALIPGLPVRQIVIWDRGSGFNFAPTHYVPTHEWVVVVAGPEFRLKSKGASGLGDVWRATPVVGSKHPAPFPTSLPARAIESTGAQTVLDPFAGSGTTLRAAADAGISGVGIELSATYCDMAIERMGQTVLDFGVTA